MLAKGGQGMYSNGGSSALTCGLQSSLAEGRMELLSQGLGLLGDPAAGCQHVEQQHLQTLTALTAVPHLLASATLMSP
jgi:hypothetical protein